MNIKQLFWYIFWYIKDFLQGKSILGGAIRSSLWYKFKKEYERKYPKQCPICGNKKCELHHKQSFASHPELELSENNVCWLCEGLGTLQHHRGIGHLGSFLSLNLDIENDIKIWKEKFDTRPVWNGQKWIYRI